MGDVGQRRGVIVDRHPLWLDAVERVLAGLDLNVVGSATTAAAAVELVEQHRADFLIVGLDTEHVDAAIEAIRRARSLSAALRIIAFGPDDDPARMRTAFAAGASAYVLKTVEPTDLAVAVRQSFGHSIYFAESQPSPPEPEPAPARTLYLTRREDEILRLVAEGYSNGEVARMLWVTEKTVKFHLSNVYRKLNVSNRTEASCWAARNGLVATETAGRASAEAKSSGDGSRIASAA